MIGFTCTVTLLVSFALAARPVSIAPLTHLRKECDVLGPLKVIPGHEQTRIGLREFLWKHWHGRQCAEVILYEATKEGMPFTRRLSLLETAASKRSIRVDLYRGRWNTRPPASASYYVYSLKRVQIGSAAPPGRELTEDEIRSARNYRILLIGENGGASAAF